MHPQVVLSGDYYVLLTMSRCSDASCRYGLVRRAGESIIHVQQQRHHMTARGLKLSS